MSDRDEDEVPTFVPPEALAELPIFPLPGSVLLPRTYVSLHIFEPRYRKMIADVIDGHRVLAVAMIDRDRAPDRFGRPAIHPVAGVGVLRRSARLPDGRYNIVLEGVLRAHVADELPPTLPYRRARAHAMPEVLPADPRALERSIASLRALCTRVVTEVDGADADVVQRLNEVSDPGTLADMIAAAALQDADEKQQILEELDVARRIDLAAAALGALLLTATDSGESTKNLGGGWGIGPAKA
ncbi:LON peptidase substrate-binding domain-containing protein [Myxococcota bacterium]|nr:LON peptidase substrate-binding domain-containing protein [Myxococcota bacterium]